jgi:hypothetical protein
MLDAEMSIVTDLKAQFQKTLNLKKVRLSETEAQLEAAQADNAKKSTKMAALQEMLEAQLEAAQAEISHQSTKVAALQQSLDTTAREAADHALEAAKAGYELGRHAAEQAAAGHLEQIASLDADRDASARGINGIRQLEQNAALEGRVAELEGRVRDELARSDALAKQLATANEATAEATRASRSSQLGEVAAVAEHEKMKRAGELASGRLCSMEKQIEELRAEVAAKQAHIATLGVELSAQRTHAIPKKALREKPELVHHEEPAPMVVEVNRLASSFAPTATASKPLVDGFQSADQSVPPVHEARPKPVQKSRLGRIRRQSVLGEMLAEKSEWAGVGSQVEPDSTPAERSAAAIVRAVPLFARLSNGDVSKLVAALEPWAVPAGTEVVREGDNGSEMYLVEAGSLSCHVAGVNYGLPIRSYTSGQFFGERALINGAPRAATVIADMAEASGPCQLLRLPVATYVEVLRPDTSTTPSSSFQTLNPFEIRGLKI